MNTNSQTRGLGDRLPLAFVALGFAAGALLFGAPVKGQDSTTPEPITQVEEDWELVLNEPNSSREAPQFQTVMSPFGNLDSYYALVIWNYRELPEYAPGGLQLQSWEGDTRLRRRGVGDTLLSTTAETITWTQALRTDGAILTFEILNGHSITWGDFGKDMQINQAASVPDLAGYDTATSVTKSWTTYGANRVDRMVITQVRRYSASGLVSVDSDPKVVYERTETTDAAAGDQPPQE
jgi:hypothetical protein